MKARAIPRSALWLVVILAVALAVLVYLRRRPEPADFTLGGPLFHTPADQIDGLLLTRDGAQYRLDRQPSGRWALSGAVRDYLDQEAVGRLLRRLTQATGGRLLAGSEPEDRRYDFNGPGAMRLTLFATDGSTEKLVVGARNPVTGGWYGSGAGRPACFPVSDGLHEVLKAIPLSQRLDKLLPLTDPAAVDTVMIQRGEITDLLARRHGRWFLRQPAEGDPALGAPYLAYRRLYQDREREEDGVRWTLANDVLVGQLVYECSGLSAQRILPPGDAARLLVGLGEGDIWRRVRLLGQGINPDPGEGSADLLEISFLPAGNAQSQPVRRLNTVLLAEVEAANTLAEPLSHLVDMRALGFRPGLADSLHVFREGRLLLRAHRDVAASALPGRIQRREVDYWLLDQPSILDTGKDPLKHHVQATHFLVDLDRTPILKALPAARNGQALKEKEQVTLVFFFPEGPQGPGLASGRVELRVGFLDREHLPAGSGDLALPPDGLEPAGMWRVDTGQLLQIPAHPITTARAWALD